MFSLSSLPLRQLRSTVGFVALSLLLFGSTSLEAQRRTRTNDAPAEPGLHRLTALLTRAEREHGDELAAAITKSILEAQ